jgi:hypothetical protein
MFQSLIDQARDMIRRLHACAEQGRDAVPEAMKIRLSELEAWENATQGILNLAFGMKTIEMSRWHALAARRAALVGEARRKDIKRGEYFGLIDYFHLATGLLLEFDAAYQRKLAATAPAAQEAMGSIGNGPPPGPQAPLATTAQASAAVAQAPIATAPQPVPPVPQAPVATAQQATPEPPSAEVHPESAWQTDDQWELTVVVNKDTYEWLYDIVAARDPARAGDADAIVEFAATIIERVAASTRRGKQ